MLLKICLAFLAMAVCVHSVVKLPEHFQAPGAVCKSGLPVDPQFASCSLDNGLNWRVGSWGGEKHISLGDITFPSRFSSVPSTFLGEEETPLGCAVRLPSQGIVFQYLDDKIAHAHYRLRGCAKVHGTTPCRLQVKTLTNHVVDELVFQPLANSSCVINPPINEDCISECSTGWSWMTVRYVGVRNISVMIQQHAIDTTGNMSPPLVFEMIKYGDEFNITAGDFLNNNPNVGPFDILPDQLEIWTGLKGDRIDIISTLCNATTVLPGQRFGDEHQFLLSRVETPEGLLCPVSRAAKGEMCPCEVDEVKEQCMESLKGFVALPEENYYIGMLSEECSCSFDNVCLDLIGNEEGYLGLDWILITNNMTSTI